MKRKQNLFEFHFRLSLGLTAWPACYLQGARHWHCAESPEENHLLTEHLRQQRLSMTLHDRLTQDEGWVYMTGMQALVRLPIQQRKRDAAAGLNTGGYISGYRGSPVGTYDMALTQAHKTLKEHNIHFQPGVNEDLAATATWGAQMVGLFPGAKVDGVFSIWYGKAPGMDRSMDPLRHANLAGTNPKGGTLLLVGDDHGAKSSTVACYSDMNFASLGAPLLAPANAQDVLDYGLHGIAMSRFASTLVGMKLVTDVVEGGGSVRVGLDSPRIVLTDAPNKDLGIRPFTPVLEQERLLWTERLGRARAYARANRLNLQDGAADARIGIIAAGKAWQDLNQALGGLGYRDGQLGNLPVRRLKLGMVWPLDDAEIRAFAEGLEAIIVIEEKRPLLEDQIRAILYGSGLSPRIIGKSFDGHSLSATGDSCAFPAVGEIDPNMVARVLMRAATELDPDCGVSMPNRATPPALPKGGTIRPPSFCAGCPHGRSTQVPDGSRALAGIGCHTMAVFRDPLRTNSISQMGGEGAMWLGQFPFTNEEHVFANMGDGTYFHSGMMAIRAAVAARVTMTYKLLFNGFVSMTGGQAHDGDLSPETMIAQLRAEGVERIALVADEPERYEGKNLGAGVSLHLRTEMAHVQREIRSHKGVSVILYDQPCATERRRLRKRGKWVDPDKRAFINPEICEGCGDCSTVSGCMAIEPLETPLGRKRQINQSSCNKDFSCVEGFCPSFVTVQGATPRKAQTADVVIDASRLPLPAPRPIDGSWSILVSGIGGAGVVTIGQTLAIAAHADGYYASNLDITGLAQKYGAVHSHIKLAISPEQMRATRIAAGEADALIGCDLVVAAGDEALSKLTPGRTRAVTDTTVIPTAEFSMNPDWQLDGAVQVGRLSTVLGDDLHSFDAQGLARQVMGDSVYANFVLMGAAWQQGGIPLSLEAIEHAIALNGVSIGQNRQAFDLGRLVIADPEKIGELTEAKAPLPLEANRAATLDQIVVHRTSELAASQGSRAVRRFEATLRKAREAGLDDKALKALARGLYKLMAVKDEWEVARLYTKPSFAEALRDSFDGELSLTFHFGAWPFGGTDPKTGQPVKGAVKGKTAMRAFRLMNRLRFLRGTLLDPFRNTDEARLARRLLANYEADIALAMHCWSSETAPLLAELLDLPEHIRGYGHVRERHAQATGKRRAEILATIEPQQAVA
ncbi:indolepyruvate ferredoxin oxidoreductase family protein [Thalassobius vesicularis]|uniref:Indolepyruvate ferredoxin oxidoreductase family protein n=1 Tax=Thalassobius vesicularis TaxID=1294297 RepID=A0A4S3M5Y0_9RHOB|nr:indolepyruvate ferredoxin oxidoreductase family protein [Thalassobius vesicularis]THD71631.1 indolepyruvate ferredoxin oxidoreductase family protein [Thalassobius vesicularis]